VPSARAGGGAAEHDGGLSKTAQVEPRAARFSISSDRSAVAERRAASH
jgi:hypothetical protein